MLNNNNHNETYEASAACLVWSWLLDYDENMHEFMIQTI